MKRRQFCSALFLPTASLVVPPSQILDGLFGRWPQVTPRTDVEKFEMNVSSDWVPIFRANIEAPVIAVTRLRSRLREDLSLEVMPILRIRDRKDLPEQTVRFAVYGTEVLRFELDPESSFIASDPSHYESTWQPITQHIESVARHYFRQLPSMPRVVERSNMLVTNLTN